MFAYTLWHYCIADACVTISHYPAKSADYTQWNKCAVEIMRVEQGGMHKHAVVRESATSLTMAACYKSIYIPVNISGQHNENDMFAVLVDHMI